MGAKPCIYGRDWGAVRAMKFRILHPKRVGGMVLENFQNKCDEAGFKARSKKDPSYALNEFMGPFLWIYDSTFPKNLGTPGKNIAGYKGKTVLFWPFHFKGKADPKGTSQSGKMAEAYAKILKCKPTDSFALTDADIANTIAANIPSD